MTDSNDPKTWDAWNSVHQPFELNYHKTQGIEWCSNEKQFHDFWDGIFDFIGIADFKDTKMLDIGCGVRPPLAKFRKTNEVFLVEPLAAGFQSFAPREWWSDMTIFNSPAERVFDELEGRMDVVMSWNNLDHTIGWKEILKNMAQYSHEKTVIAIATDFHPPGVGHPGFPKEEFMAEVAKYFDILKSEEGFRERDLAMVLKKK